MEGYIVRLAYSAPVGNDMQIEVDLQLSDRVVVSYIGAPHRFNDAVHMLYEWHIDAIKVDAEDIVDVLNDRYIGVDES